MNAALILRELEGLGLSFQPIGDRLAHRFCPPGPVDGERMSSLLLELANCRSQALDFLNQAKVIPFPERRERS